VVFETATEGRKSMTRLPF